MAKLKSTDTLSIEEIHNILYLMAYIGFSDDLKGNDEGIAHQILAEYYGYVESTILKEPVIYDYDCQQIC